jgi:hypothetical protein
MMGSPMAMMARGGGGAVVPDIPMTLPLVMDFDPNSFPAQADNSTLSAFTDPASGTTFATTGAPKYRTLGSGQAGVDFAGTNYIDIGRAAALSGAMEGGSYTVIAVVENLQVTPFGGYLSSGTPYIYHMLANGANTGRNALGVRNKPPLTGTATYMLAHTVDGVRERDYIEGGCVHSVKTAGPPGAATANYSIGATATGTFGMIGRIRRLMIFSGVATPSDMLAVRAWMTQVGYFAANPWDSLPVGYKFTLFDGSSLIPSEKASLVDYSLAYRYKVAKGLAYGQYSMIGLGGNNMTEITAKLAEEVGRVPAIIGGLPIRVGYLEWYNTKSSPTILADAATLIAAYQSAGATVAWGTSTDQGGADSSPVSRATYNTHGWVATAGADAVINIHENVNIGVDGTAGNSYFDADRLHLSDSGYGVFEALMRAGVDSV